MSIREILSSLDLEDLAGTPFEDLVKIRKLEAGEVLIEEREDTYNACFIYRGSIQVTTYSIEGKGIYTYREEGDMVRMAESFSHRIDKTIHTDTDYGIEILAREETILVYLPFHRLIEMEVPHKERIMTKLLLLTAEEGIREKSYFVGRMVYSDMEFLLKALEKLKTIEALTAKELSQALNMNLRNLQRLLTKLETEGIVVRQGGYVSIKDMDKFHRYLKCNMD